MIFGHNSVRFVDMSFADAEVGGSLSSFFFFFFFFFDPSVLRFFLWPIFGESCLKPK